MAVILLVGLLPYWNYFNIGISAVVDKIYFWYFWIHSQDIYGLFPNYSLFLVYLSVCMPVFIFLPIGRLWGPTSETFGLVRLLIKKLLDCISLKWFSACLVFMPTIRTANLKPPVIDIQPLKYYNYFPTTFLMIYLKRAKKVNRNWVNLNDLQSLPVLLQCFCCQELNQVN